MKTITEIKDRAHAHAVKIGAYDCKHCTGYCPSCLYYDGCKYEYREDSGCCDDYECVVCNSMNKGSAEQNIIDKLREEVEEFADAVKNNKIAEYSYLQYHIEHTDTLFEKDFKKYIKNTKGDELADIIITALAGAKELDIDIENHIQAKLRYNEVRKYET